VQTPKPLNQLPKKEVEEHKERIHAVEAAMQVLYKYTV